MRQLTTITLVSLLLSGLAFTVSAESEVSIPEKVKANILQRHPKAHDLQASHEKHFGHDLLEVTFKEDDKELTLDLFEADGHFFTAELPLVDLNEAPSAVKATLEKNFPGYALKKAELIVNPNAAGEEYEVYVVVGGVNWKVSINEKGNIEGQDRY